MTTDVAIVEQSSYVPAEIEAFAPAAIVRQVHLIQEVMRDVMKDGEHYGVVPGCGSKPSLLKPGAEKLGLVFRLAPAYLVEIVPIQHPTIPGHREYRVTCTLTSTATGRVMGQGVGSACTMEGKWRYRTGPVEETGHVVPREYWDVRSSDPARAQALLGGKGFATKKIDGTWMIVRQGDKCENDNPADLYNTVLKMGKKRAHVDAILTATAASDIFTQDIEEMVEVLDVTPPRTVAPAAPAAPAPTAPAPRSTAPEAATAAATVPVLGPLPQAEAMTDDEIRGKLTHLGVIIGRAQGKTMPVKVEEWSAFESTRNGKTSTMKKNNPMELKDKWLKSTYGKAKKEYEAMNVGAPDQGESEGPPIESYEMGDIPF
jgi:hypothetical protein